MGLLAWLGAGHLDGARPSAYAKGLVYRLKEMPMPSSRRERMAARLETAFQPLRLEIIDESAAHAGHAGAQPGGETHFQIEIVSGVFTGKTRVDRQRLVHRALADEFAGSLHALRLKALAPLEDQAG